MIPHNRMWTTDADAIAAFDVVRSGHLAQGPQVEAFEAELAAYLGRPAACVSSGTAAMYLALEILKPERITAPTYTCASLLYAARLAAVSVELVDSGWPHFGADADVACHTYGVPYMPLFPVIEDLSHAFGPGVGRVGIIAVMSLGATKVLPAGAGGVVFGSDAVIRQVKDRRDYDGHAATDRQRFHWQMSDVHAAIGRQQLKRYADALCRRRMFARDLAAVVRQSSEWTAPNAGMGTEYRFIAFAPDRHERDRVLGALWDRGVTAIVPMTQAELLHNQRGEPPDAFPVAERAAQVTLSIPCYPALTRDERAHVLSAVADALGVSL